MGLIWLVRHGETEWSRQGRLQGGIDVPLSEVGRRDARLVACRLAAARAAASASATPATSAAATPAARAAATPVARMDRLLASPLGRARETAEIIGSVLGLETEIVPELREMSFGEFEGKTIDEMEALSPGFGRAWKENPAAVLFPGGESLADLEARCLQFVRRLESETGSGVGTVLVSHGQVARTILCWALGLEQNARNRFTVQCASISVIEADRGRARVISMNETGHLQLDP